MHAFELSMIQWILLQRATDYFRVSFQKTCNFFSIPKKWNAQIQQKNTFSTNENDTDKIIYKLCFLEIQNCCQLFIYKFLMSFNIQKNIKLRTTYITFNFNCMKW